MRTEEETFEKPSIVQKNSRRKIILLWNKVLEGSILRWPLVALIAIILVTGVMGVPALVDMFKPKEVQDYNPAFAGVSVEELPLVVNMNPNNLRITEDTWTTIGVSIFNPKDFDITKSLVLLLSFSEWNSTTLTWGPFGNFTQLIKFGNVTVHPKNSVEFKVPFLLEADTTDNENIEKIQRLYTFKLTTGN